MRRQRFKDPVEVTVVRLWDGTVRVEVDAFTPRDTNIKVVFDGDPSMLFCVATAIHHFLHRERGLLDNLESAMRGNEL